MNQEDLVVLKVIKELLQKEPSNEMPHNGQFGQGITLPQNSLENSLTHLEERLEKLAVQQNQLQAKTQKIQNSQENLQAQKTEINQFQTQLKYLEGKTESLHTLFERTQAQLVTQNQAPTFAHEDGELLKTKVHQLEGRLDTLVEMTEKTQTQFLSLTQSIKEQESEKYLNLEKLISQVQLQVENLTAQNTAAAMGQLEEKIKLQTLIVADLEEKLSNANQEITALKEVNKQSTQAPAQWQQKTEELTQQLAQLRTTFEQTNEKFLKLSRGNTDKNTDETLKQFTTQLSAFETQMQQTHKVFQETTENLLKQQTELELLKTEHAQALEKIAHLEEILNSTQEKGNEIKNQKTPSLKSTQKANPDAAISSVITDGAGQLNYLESLQKISFKTESDLQSYFPKSFLVQAQYSDLPQSFLWVGEKIGLVYIALVHCQSKASKDNFLPVFTNFLLNHLINESKLMDINALTEALNQKMAETLKQNPDSEDKVSLGLCVIDEMNSTLYFSGANTDLISNHKNLTTLAGNTNFLGNAPQKGLKKHTIPVNKGTKFYMNLKNHTPLLEETLAKMKNLDLKVQRNELEAWGKAELDSPWAVLAFGL